MRCEVEKRDGNFMTLGPRLWKRCPNAATMLVLEEGYVSGPEGKMPMCAECYQRFREYDNRPHKVEPVPPIQQAEERCDDANTER